MALAGTHHVVGRHFRARAKELMPHMESELQFPHQNFRNIHSGCLLVSITNHASHLNHLLLSSPYHHTPFPLFLFTNFIMPHCHDEHDHHGHDLSEGAAHDHTDDLTPALQNHIYEQIDFSAINTLNESEPRAGTAIVQKTWSERLDNQPELESDADEQLLMHVPYVLIHLHNPRGEETCQG
jgi:hypothetical protein